MKKILVGLGILSIIGWSVYTSVYSSGSNSLEGKYPLYKKLELLADVLTIVQKSYVKEVSAEKLVYGAIKGIMGELDPHSQFLTPDAYNEMKIETKGEFGGLGVEITIRDRTLTIISALEGTPAYNAGLKSGDKIIKIDGQSTKDMDLDTVVKKLRGKPGTKVHLTIMRPGKPHFLEFDIIREMIKIESVKDVQIIEDGIGYIRIIQFQDNTVSDTKEALEKLRAKNMNSLILDLRNNPGGVLEDAIEFASLFIRSPKLIVSTKGRLASQNNEFRSKNKDADEVTPIVILINGGSASGSEIVAGAMRDYHRAVLLGERTFGKGSVQTVLPLRDGSAVKLTTATYFTPKGEDINEVGITPDIVVHLTEEQEERLWKERKKGMKKIAVEYDPQLQRAIDLLKGINVFKKTNRIQFKVKKQSGGVK